MAIAERIYEKLRSASPEVAQEVLEFLEFLEQRRTTETSGTVLATWDASFGVLKGSPRFEGDPVEIQRDLRDEWP